VPSKLYATAMTSFRAEEHGQAVLEFTELIDKFPKHTLAASAQYWIGEAYYRLVRVERRDEAESLWRMALRGTLPVSVKDATRRRVRRAAELKSKHAIAYADAFAVATAVEFNAILLTGDPEIEPLEGEQNLKVEWLPRRP